MRKIQKVKQSVLKKYDKISFLKSEVVELQGGLGNQLFGYAYAQYRAEINNHKVALDIKKLTKFGFQLKPFGVSIKAHMHILKTLKEIQITFQKNWLIHYFFTQIFKIIEKISFRKIVSEDDTVPKFYSRVLHQGYFQKIEYFSNYVYREVYKLRDNFQGTRLFNELNNQNIFTNSLAIHVRGGDYLKHSDIFLLPSSLYYKAAIEKLNPNNDIPMIVFTDDFEYAHKMIPHPKLIIDKSYNLTPADTMMLMSKASKFIGANSTFSWWAALFRSSQYIPPIFPWPWLKNSSETPDSLLPTNWNKITLDSFGNPA